MSAASDRCGLISTETGNCSQLVSPWSLSQAEMSRSTTLNGLPLFWTWRGLVVTPSMPNVLYARSISSSLALSRKNFMKGSRGGKRRRRSCRRRCGHDAARSRRKVLAPGSVRRAAAGALRISGHLTLNFPKNNTRQWKSDRRFRPRPVCAPAARSAGDGAYIPLLQYGFPPIDATGPSGSRGVAPGGRAGVGRRRRARRHGKNPFPGNDMRCKPRSVGWLSPNAGVSLRKTPKLLRTASHH